MTSTPCQGPCAGLCTESGFAAAYSAHRPRLLAKAMAVVGDRQHAEDAVQDAFLRAWSKCSTFDPDGPPLAAWLTTITRNVGGSWYTQYPMISAHDDTPIMVTSSTIE